MAGQSLPPDTRSMNNVGGFLPNQNGCSRKLDRYRTFLSRRKEIKGGCDLVLQGSQSKVNHELVLDRLNKIWIDYYVIRAYGPKFGRDQGCGKGRPRRGFSRQKHREERVETFQPAKRKEGVSFLEALTGLRNKREEAGIDGHERSDECSEQHKSAEEEGRWLDGAFTGCLKCGFSWEEHGMEIQTECLGSLKISNMGGNLVLIRCEGEGAVEEVLKVFEEWNSFWWEWCCPWEYTDVNRNKEVWTRRLGVPLQAWNGSFFAICCAKFGNYVKLHEQTKKRERLDEAIILVSTGLEQIDQTLSCRINGECFLVRVEEIKIVDSWIVENSGTASVSESKFEPDGEMKWSDDDSVFAGWEMAADYSSGEERSITGGIGEGGR